MELTVAQIGQLAAALILAIILFSAAYSTPLRISAAILIVLIPFQAVSTQYGSSNVVITYILAGALALNGEKLRFPMLGLALGTIFIYLISMSQAYDGEVFTQHGIYIFGLVSAMLVFYVSYNFSRSADARYVINVLLLMNVFVSCYCAIQIFVGAGEELTLFGIDELTMDSNRGGTDPRLNGPFNATGLTAEYMVFMILICLYELLSSKGWRRFGITALISADLAFLVASGNRGGFLTLMGASLLFLYEFRKDLGYTRVVRILMGGGASLVLTSILVVTFTDFGVLYSRLAGISFEGGIPSTRTLTWPTAWAEIKQAPVIGHGPRLRLIDDTERPYDGHVVIEYPHNLYLYLLFTVGILGAVIFLAFLLQISKRVWRSRRLGFPSEYHHGLVRLAPIILVAFFVDQIKIEFLRVTALDYTHFVFCLFGILLGLADQGARSASVPRASSIRTPAIEAV